MNDTTGSRTRGQTFGVRKSDTVDPKVSSKVISFAVLGKASPYVEVHRSQSQSTEWITSLQPNMTSVLYTYSSCYRSLRFRWEREVSDSISSSALPSTKLQLPLYSENHEESTLVHRPVNTASDKGHISVMTSTEKDPATIMTAKTLLSNLPWCDDYEKMISGMYYDSMVPELRAGRFRARKLIKQYNDHFPDDATEESLAEDRMVMLKELIGCIGKGVDIDPPFHVDYGCNICIGDGFYANFNLTILDCAIVMIGNRVKFGPNVSIFAATHPVDVQTRRDSPDYSEGVSIGNDCWIGGHTVIMPGVTIGHGVTIGASSVVTKNIPSFSVALGSPARVVKKL